MATGRPNRSSPAAQLQRGAAYVYPLTLLIAPAGWGKTSLLRRWSAGERLPVAWVALAPGDDRPEIFLAHVAGALAAIAGPAGIPPRDLPSHEVDLTGEDGAVAVINAAAEATMDFALVLDEYHQITCPTVHGIVSRALDYPPPFMHLIIAARSFPPLPLARLRARGQLLLMEIGD
jgi:LuxR family maltose regulon positive regulatory protein